MTRLVSSCLLLLISGSLSTRAQQAPAKKPPVEKAATKESQPRDAALKKIVSVLDQVLDEQNGFQDGPLRVLIQANVADLLWGYNQPRARQLFETALQDCARLPEPDPSARWQGPTVTPSSARASVIRLIMPRDSDWATKLIQSVGEITDADSKDRMTAPYRERAMLRLNLAMYFAQQDPQRALQVLKPFAENGDVNSLMTVLPMLKSKDAAKADDLFHQALAKARSGQSTFIEIQRLAHYVFPFFGEGVSRFSSGAGNRDPLDSGSTDPAAVRDFVDFAYETATRRLDAALKGTDELRLDPGSAFDYELPKILEAYIDRYMPDKAVAFRTLVEEVRRRVPAEQRPYLLLTDKSSVQDVLSRAELITDAALRDRLYQRAMQQSAASGDFDQASAILEKVTNEPARSSMKFDLHQRIDQISVEEGWAALSRGDFDKAETLIARISEWRASALLMQSLVGQLTAKDRARAARILDEYEHRTREIQDGTERSQRLMELANVAANINPNRGFELMKAAIGEFNVAGFVPELQRFRNTEGKSVTSLNVNIGISRLLGNWSFRWLGRTDFDRAIALTQQLQMKEAGALMQIEVCRGALGALQQTTLQPVAMEANQKKALALLDQLLNTAKSFEDDEVRIRVQVQVADVLWQRDERRARRLFETAFQDIASTALPPQDKNIPPSFIGADSRFPLRNDVIRLVAQHDTALAAKLIDSMVDQPPNVDAKFLGSGYGKYSEQDMLRLQFANFIAHSDPQRAGQIADTFSKKGDVRSTASILESLRSKDRSLADELCAQTLTRIAQSPATSSENVRLLADYVFPGFGEGTIRFTTGSRPQSENGKASPELTAQFLDLAYNAAMSWPVVADGRQGGDRTIAKLLMPYFDEYAPEKSNALRTRFAGASGESIEEADDLQSLLNRAEKATNQTERDLLYANAVMNATRRRDLDRASQILERISNERTRSQVSLALNRAKEEERYQKAQAVLRSGDFEAAYKLINELPDRNRHLWMLCNLAGSLFSKNDTTRALLILGEAEQQIKSGQDNVDKARNTLQLVSVAGRMDPKRGFENLKAAVDTINHLDLAPQWQRFETVGDAKNGMMARTNVGLEVLFAFFDNSVSQIARVDFDRALQLAQGIQMREASVLAQLVICRAVLMPPSAR